MTTTKRLYTASELAEVLGLSRKAVYARVRRGQIPALAIGASYRFDLDEVLARMRGERGR